MNQNHDAKDGEGEVLHGGWDWGVLSLELAVWLGKLQSLGKLDMRKNDERFKRKKNEEINTRNN